MPRRHPVVTLLTDFGTADTYVGQMKGVILARCPAARIVDLTHEIPAGDVCAAAFALASAAGHFPKGTVHVAVVDPRVGTGQPRLAVRAGGGDYFLAPDNGLVGPALGDAAKVEARRLSTEGAAPTFHGRDVFAPAAAHLAAGRRFSALGPRAGKIARLKLPRPRRTARGLAGEVVHVDRFGNLVTNLHPREMPAGDLVFRVGRARVRGPFVTYGQVPAGRALALAGSSGLVEIAVNGGSAARKLKARRGTRVTVTHG